MNTTNSTNSSNSARPDLSKAFEGDNTVSPPGLKADPVPNTSSDNTSDRINTFESPQHEEKIDTAKMAADYDSLTNSSDNNPNSGGGDKPPKNNKPKLLLFGDFSKMVAPVLAALVLMIGSVAGVYLVRQNQEIRQQASGDCNSISYSISTSPLCFEGSAANLNITASRGGTNCPEWTSPSLPYYINECDQRSCDGTCGSENPTGSLNITIQAGQNSASESVNCSFEEYQCGTCQVDMPHPTTGQEYGSRVFKRTNCSSPTPSSTPTPSPPAQPFSCINVDMNPNVSALAQGFTRTLTSTVNRPTILRSYFSVYKAGGLPVCVAAPNTAAANGCPVNTKQLTFEGNELPGGINGQVALNYNQLAVPDNTGTVNRNISITAFHTSTDGQYAGSAAACIKNLTLVACGGINPNTVNLTPTNNSIQVQASSLPTEGLEAGKFGLFQNGQRVCALSANINQHANVLEPGPDCGGGLNQVMVKGVLSGSGTSKRITGTFTHTSLRNFIQPGTGYNFTAFLRVYGQEVGSQANCIGNLSITIASPTPTPPTQRRTSFLPR